MRNVALVLSAACFVAGCGASPGAEPTSLAAPPSATMNDELPSSKPAPTAYGAPWATSLLADHPLVGRIWQPSTKAFVKRETLEHQAARARFVLLGDKHDNPDHHRLQLEMLTAATNQRSGRMPALVLEMLELGAQPAVDQFRAGASNSADAFADAVGWHKQAWDWSMYRGIIAKGLQLDMPIVAANLPRDQARQIVKQGAAAPALEGLTLPELTAAQLAELEQELRDSHCGMMPERMLPGMVLVQRARDAIMAKQLRSGRHGAVLIAGAGHVRTDRGVGALLGEPAEDVLTMAWLEVRQGIEDPAKYFTDGSGQQAPFDYLWFTPRLDDKDHCEELRRTMPHKRRGGPSEAPPR